MHLYRWIILGALHPGMAVIAQRIRRAAVLLVAYGLLYVAIDLRVEGRRLETVRAACLLYRATQTATGLLVGGNPGAALPTHRYWAEAEAGRQALTEARVECR